MVDFIIFEKEEKYSLLYITQKSKDNFAFLTYSRDFSTKNTRQIHISNGMKFIAAGEGKHIVMSNENSPTAKKTSPQNPQISQNSKNYFYISYEDNPLRQKLIYEITGLENTTINFQLDLQKQILMLDDSTAYAFDIGNKFLEKAFFTASTKALGTAIAFLRVDSSTSIQQSRLLFSRTNKLGNTIFTTFDIRYFDKSYIQCKFGGLGSKDADFFFNATTLERSYMRHLKFKPFAVELLLILVGCGLLLFVIVLIACTRKTSDTDSIYTGGRPNSTRNRRTRNRR